VYVLDGEKKRNYQSLELSYFMRGGSNEGREGGNDFLPHAVMRNGSVLLGKQPLSRTQTAIGKIRTRGREGHVVEGQN